MPTAGSQDGIVANVVKAPFRVLGWFGKTAVSIVTTIGAIAGRIGVTVGVGMLFVVGVGTAIALVAAKGFNNLRPSVRQARAAEGVMFGSEKSLRERLSERVQAMRNPKTFQDQLEQGPRPRGAKRGAVREAFANLLEGVERAVNILGLRLDLNKDGQISVGLKPGSAPVTSLSKIAATARARNIAFAPAAATPAPAAATRVASDTPTLRPLSYAPSAPSFGIGLTGGPGDGGAGGTGNGGGNA